MPLPRIMCLNTVPLFWMVVEPLEGGPSGGRGSLWMCIECCSPVPLLTWSLSASWSAHMTKSLFQTAVTAMYSSSWWTISSELWSKVKSGLSGSVRYLFTVMRKTHWVGEAEYRSANICKWEHMFSPNPCGAVAVLLILLECSQGWNARTGTSDLLHP